MRTRIKICCIASAEEAQLAIAAGADALGFIGVVPPSPRAIPDEAIAGIAATVPPPVATVLVSSQRDAEAISAQVRRTRPSVIQVVAPIDPAEWALLAELEPHLRRIQVIHVEGPEALDFIPLYAPHVHAFLLDSGKAASATPYYGGTGETHDWAISAAFVARSPLPVFLAGGITPANAAEAIRQVRPYGLDLCTGLRTDGRLDPARLAEVVRAVRDADAERAAS
jgi:phosphoribosylanthranilate isomerase